MDTLCYMVSSFTSDFCSLIPAAFPIAMDISALNTDVADSQRSMEKRAAVVKNTDKYICLMERDKNVYGSHYFQALQLFYSTYYINNLANSNL